MLLCLSLIFSKGYSPFLKSLSLTKLFLDFSPYLYYNIIVDNIKEFQMTEMRIDDLIRELQEIKKKHGNIRVEVQYRDDGGDYFGSDNDVLLYVENKTIDLDDDGSIREEKTLLL